MKAPSYRTIGILGALLVALAVALAVFVASDLGSSTSSEGMAPPVGSGASAVPFEPESETVEVADGLTLTTITDAVGPNRIYMLMLTPSETPMTLDVVMPRNGFGGAAPLTRIADRHGAIAAINGDYGTPSLGRPLHLFAMDGRLIQTSLINQAGRNFAMSADERTAFFGRPEVSIVLRRADGRSFDIQRWNDGEPGPDAVVAYSEEAVGIENPPPNACSVRLVPTSSRSWTPNHGVRREYSVEVIRCGEDPVQVTPGSVVLSALPAGTRAADVEGLALGERVQLDWSLGWPGVLDAIGGSVLLVDDGEVVTEKCHLGYECWRHPRTGVGITADGRILLVVLDGRRPGYSLGMRREDFAVLMLSLGAVDAMALDGGGSSEMVVEGRIVNRPSGNEERPLESALVVLPGPDPDEELLALPGPG